jgi:hypothetical protein
MTMTGVRRTATTMMTMTIEPRRLCVLSTTARSRDESVVLKKGLLGAGGPSFVNL